MRAGLGWLVYLIAVAITLLVIVSKFSLYPVPQPIDGWIKTFDYANWLLIALALSFISKWV